MHGSASIHVHVCTLFIYREAVRLLTFGDGSGPGYYPWCHLSVERPHRSWGSRTTLFIYFFNLHQKTGGKAGDRSWMPGRRGR